MDKIKTEIHLSISKIAGSGEDSPSIGQIFLS